MPDDKLASTTDRNGTDNGPAYPGAPRWVKLSGTLAALLAVLVVVVLIAGGGPHGPRRHLPASVGSGETGLR